MPCAWSCSWSKDAGTRICKKIVPYSESENTLKCQCVNDEYDWICEHQEILARESAALQWFARVLLHDFFRIAPEERIHHDVLGCLANVDETTGTETKLKINWNPRIDQQIRACLLGHSKVHEISTKIYASFDIYKFKKSPWNHLIKVTFHRGPAHSRNMGRHTTTQPRCPRLGTWQSSPQIQHLHISPWLAESPREVRVFWS